MIRLLAASTLDIGVRPAILVEGGLRPALEALARRSAVPVRLDVQADARFPEPIEIAAYYVVCEALTNAATHAHATVIDLTRGSGLVGLTDRVEALGGRIWLVSPPGAGTTLQMALPLTAPGGPEPPAAVMGRPDDTGRDPAAEPEPSGPRARKQTGASPRAVQRS